MTSRQSAQLREVRGLWTKYGAALRAKTALAGGMTWKSVGGGEYLCRYWQDPRTGKKRFTSLGPRSADTEATYHRYMAEREGARGTLTDMDDEIVLTGRLAKALGLARMPAKNAETIRAFWLASLFDERLLVIGGDALFAYELDAEVMVPIDLSREDTLTFLLREDVDLGAAMNDFVFAYADASGEPKPRVAKTDRGMRLTALDFPAVVIVPQRWFIDRLDRGRKTDWAARSDLREQQAAVLQEALARPPITGVAIARASKPVELKVPDPRAYALMMHVAAEHEVEFSRGTDGRRAAFTAALVRERWPEKFDERQEAAFGPLCRGEDDEGPGLIGP